MGGIYTAKAKRLSSGNFRVQVSTGEKNEKGKYIYESITAPTEKEANLAALQYEIKRKATARDPANITLEEAMQSYIDNKDGILSPSTLRAYHAIKNNNLKRIKQYKINKLNKNIIQSAINDEAKLHSPKTVRNIYGFLSAVLKENNFSLDINVSLPPKQKRVMQVFDKEQITVLLKIIKGMSIEIPVLLAIWLGLRQSEICGLKWDCIDFKNSAITIKAARVRNINNEMVLKSTKTYSSVRVLKIPEYILNKLKELPRDNEFVINKKGNAILSAFKKLLAKNNLPYIRFHDLRHTNASVMLALNVPDKYAMERGGWATNNTMKNIYQHTFNNEKEIVDNLVNSYFEKALSHELSHKKKKYKVKRSI